MTSAAHTLLSQAKRVRYVLGDKRDDSGASRAMIGQQSARPVIPGKANRKRKFP